MTRVGVPSLEPEQRWVPRMDWNGVGAVEDVPAKEPSSEVECPVPCGRDPNLQVQAGPPTAQASLPYLKDFGH